MAQIHEKLVEEWLRRQRYFTIRSAKFGVSEIDLLAMSVDHNGKITRRHVEVQISFRPVGFITGKSAKKRTKEETENEVDLWMLKKFQTTEVVRLRNTTVGIGSDTDQASWQFDFVHHIVRDPYELELMRKKGINTIAFDQIKEDLRKSEGRFSFMSDADDMVSLLKMK
tara:strand:- start:110 stop:616 length:507 start_codon:yes stop_codon:yes gene_type:complete